jgi:ATP-dependent helicase/nuclease subunit A
MSQAVPSLKPALLSDDPRAQATRRQHDAASPDAFAWVDASAGSGKTTVLISRVLRLLLRGVAPHRILCLTFTKAAAANMANRLTATLARWAVLSESELAKELLKLTETHPGEETLLTARRLFARTLETPNGMQFLTIHGFCQSLLARFPLEAGVPLGFNVLDERSSSQLLAQIRQDLLGEPTMAVVVDELLEIFGPEEFPKLADEVIAARSVLEPALQQGPRLALERLRMLLELEPGASVEKLEQDFRQQLITSREEIIRLSTTYASGSDEDKGKSEELLLWLEQSDLEAYLTIFLTNDGGIRKRLATKPLLTKEPDLAARLEFRAQQALAYVNQRGTLRTFDISAAVILYTAELLGRYQKAKQQRLALDFEDLIVQATRLVTQKDAAPWVLYKLDGGIEHVLVDEAQDTNPLQWTLLQALTSEFTVGDGRYDSSTARTVFAVGDFKQSIFSFQGARPQAFLQARESFRRSVTQAGQNFRAVDFIVSFRSVAAVLDVVDATFQQAPANEGLPDYQGHISALSGLPGLVDLWPPAPADTVKDTDTSPQPTQRRELTHPRSKLAHVLAAQMRAWVESEHLLPARSRAVCYGDFLVLVRARGAFVGELIRACKREGVPVAGADRMVLLDQLAVEDVLAFIDFLLLPQDNLILATLLRSPFIDLPEEKLFDLAHGRAGTLWQALGHNPSTRSIAAWLDGWLDLTDRITPYTLIARLLAEPCPASTRSGRHALIARLGPDANDPLDELLSATLSYEQNEAPSLQGFQHWIHLSDASIKREMEQAGNQVRIMTAHGAKGLESPVVILADGLSLHNKSKYLLADPDGVEPPFARLPKEPARGAALDERQQQLRALELEEYNRLLYVALTRAEDWLILASWHRKGTKNADMSSRKADARSWMDLVNAGLQRIGAQPQDYDFTNLSPSQGWTGQGLRYAVAGSGQRNEKHGERAALTSQPIALPNWTLQPPVPEPTPARPLQPSKQDDEGGALSPLAGSDDYRWQRGILIHRLLQTLPDLPPVQWQAAGRRWLSGLPSEIAQRTLAEITTILQHPEFSAFFGPGSRAEVPLTGIVGEKVISGQIDRLVVLPDTVWILDFKTNRPPALTATDVPVTYLRQLASYRAVLMPIYPDKTIKTALLWTHEARLMPIPDALLDAVAHSP